MSDVEKFLRDNAEYIRARYGSENAARAAWDEPGWYDRGGYIPGGPTPVWLDADECLFSLADVEVGRNRCCRPGHPTPTSDCGRAGATIDPA